MSCLQQACTRVLDGLQTSVAADEALLESMSSEAAEGPVGLAVQWRLGYKRCVLLLLLLLLPLLLLLVVLRHSLCAGAAAVFCAIAYVLVLLLLVVLRHSLCAGADGCGCVQMPCQSSQGCAGCPGWPWLSTRRPEHPATRS